MRLHQLEAAPVLVFREFLAEARAARCFGTMQPRLAGTLPTALTVRQVIIFIPVAARAAVALAEPLACNQKAATVATAAAAEAAFQMAAAALMAARAATGSWPS